ncbi:MAG: hypothetical protein ACJA0S_000235 [Rickettsiales bacterium]|jgi:hypothetical protein
MLNFFKFYFIIVLLSGASSVLVAMLLLNVVDGKMIFDGLEHLFEKDNKHLLCDAVVAIDGYVAQIKTYIGDYFERIFDVLFSWVSSGGVNESDIYHVSEIALKKEIYNGAYCIKSALLESNISGKN